MKNVFIVIESCINRYSDENTIGCFTSKRKAKISLIKARKERNLYERLRAEDFTSSKHYINNRLYTIRRITLDKYSNSQVQNEIQLYKMYRK
jgi:hypothetical protein